MISSFVTKLGMPCVIMSWSVMQEDCSVIIKVVVTMRTTPQLPVPELHYQTNVKQMECGQAPQAFPAVISLSGSAQRASSSCPHCFLVLCFSYAHTSLFLLSLLKHLIGWLHCTNTIEGFGWPTWPSQHKNHVFVATAVWTCTHLSTSSVAVNVSSTDDWWLHIC